MKILRYLLPLMLLSFIIFIIWMNVTPGHFQKSACACSVTYMTNEEALSGGQKLCILGMCRLTIRNILLDPILTLFSLVDFNK